MSLMQVRIMYDYNEYDEKDVTNAGKNTDDYNV